MKWSDWLLNDYLSANCRGFQFEMIWLAVINGCLCQIRVFNCIRTQRINFIARSKRLFASNSVFTLYRNVLQYEIDCWKVFLLIFSLMLWRTCVSCVLDWMWPLVCFKFFPAVYIIIISLLHTGKLITVKVNFCIYSSSVNK